VKKKKITKDHQFGGRQNLFKVHELRGNKRSVKENGGRLPGKKTGVSRGDFSGGRKRAPKGGPPATLMGWGRHEEKKSGRRGKGWGGGVSSNGDGRSRSFRIRSTLWGGGVEEREKGEQKNNIIFYHLEGTQDRKTDRIRQAKIIMREIVRKRGKGQRCREIDLIVGNSPVGRGKLEPVRGRKTNFY